MNALRDSVLRYTAYCSISREKELLFHIAVGSVQCSINISVGDQDVHIENKLRNSMRRHSASF